MERRLAAILATDVVGYPHLSYSIAPPYSVDAFVTHDPGRKLTQRTPVVSAQPYRAGDRAPH